MAAGDTPLNLEQNQVFTVTKLFKFNYLTRDNFYAVSTFTSGAEQQKIIIKNNCGEKLVGLLHETGSKEIVIVCHGFQGTKEYSMMVELACALEKQGISAFRFDFSGNGESEGLFEFGNYRKEVDDLHAVVQHFAATNRDVSAIIGHSKGGNVVVLYASLHHDVPTVVNLSGRYKMDRGIEERLGKDYLERAKKDGFIDIKSPTGEVAFRVTEESLMERLNTNMREAGLKIDPDCRVLTVHGSADEVIPVEDALEFAKIIPNHELRIIEGANHCYDNHRDDFFAGSHRDKLVSIVLDFIKAKMHRVTTVIEEPVVDEPVVDEPVIEEPIIEEPVVEEPVHIV
ncbi:hypothetical protein SSX86_020305 [Deinandra increscens subsp. villosa]|uniref:Serine aminopeptidase S33 domain-containing protein n=1 Tax=Deinandra increscens subsp. villosa TaxID=3103831 RepID=A0AAP0CP33_9ASTR